MPLLHRKPFETKPLPRDLKPEDEGFYCPLTKELFTDYEEFFERTILCNSLVWSCSITNRPNLTYQEALDCEKAARKKFLKFPKQLQKPVLFLVKLMQKSRIEDLNDTMLAFIKKRYFVGEEVEVKVKATKYEQCQIIDVLSTKPGSTNESQVNGHENGGVSSDDDDDKPLSKFIKPKALEPHEVRYQVKILGPCIDPVRVVPWTAVRRKIKREQTKIFLKSTCYQDPFLNRIYFVKERIAKQIGLSNTKWGDVFAGPEPVFSGQSPKTKKTMERTEEQKAAEKERAKEREREKDLLQEVKRQEKEMKLEMKKREAEEAKRLKLLAMEQKRREAKERLERLREERLREKVEREELKEVKRRLAEYKKEWNKQRDDLECDDLKDIPSPREIVTRVPPHLFGDVLALLEFFHTFEALFDAKDEFPKGVNLDVLEKAIMDQDQDGPLCDFLFFFLSNLFRTHIEEEGETFYELEPGDKDLASDVMENPSAEKLVAHATLAATWPERYQGCAINKLELDSYTVTEVLRLYLISSAARVPADSRTWRAQQRGYYTVTDDTPLKMCLDRPDLIQKLSSVSIFNFKPEEKIEILSCLINHLLSYVTPRDYIEEVAEKYLAAQNEYREDKRSEKKREKEATADRIKWKNEQAWLERERRLKLQENMNKQSIEIENNVTNENLDPELSKKGAEEREGSIVKREGKLMTHEEQMEHLQMLEEEEKVAKEAWEFRETKHLEAIAKHQKYKVLPIGEDRFFRRYWTLNCIPGVIVEEYIESDLTDELLKIKVAQQGQPTWTWSSQSITPTRAPGAITPTFSNLNGNISAASQIVQAVKLVKNEQEIAQINGTSSEVVDVTSLKEPTSNVNTVQTASTASKDAGCLKITRDAGSQGRAARWFIYSEKEEIEHLLSSLNRRGFRESKLREVLWRNRQNIFSKLSKCPVNELCRKPNEREEERKRVKAEASAKAIELSLRDQLLDLESRIFEGTLGGIKDEDGYKWVERLTHCQEYEEEFRDYLIKSVQLVEDSSVNGTMTDGADDSEQMEVPKEGEQCCPPVVRFPLPKLDQEESEEDVQEKMEVDQNDCNQQNTLSSTVTDLALALLQIERGIDRKYLKAPLGYSEDRRRTRSKATSEEPLEEKEQKKRISEELLRRWENSLINSTSISQVSLHLATLNRCVIWARSVLNASCNICKRKGDAEKMLLCDSCDRGHHMYCLRPALKNVPSGNWYCPECKPRNSNRLSPRKVRTTSFSQEVSSEEEDETEEETEEEDDEEEDEEEEEEESSEEEEGESEYEDPTPPKRELKYKVPQKPAKTVAASRGRKSKQGSPEASTSKTRGRSAGRATESRSRGGDTRKSPRTQSERRKRPAYDDEIDVKASVNRRRSTGVWKDLNACQNILKELMAHKDSWPFLLPVSKKQVPDYYDIIKSPMDFSTMQNKFKSIEYTDPAEFIADVKLVFSNCLLYNMPRSVHAKAAVTLGGFFEKKIRDCGLERYKGNEANPPAKRRKS